MITPELTRDDAKKNSVEEKNRGKRGREIFGWWFTLLTVIFSLGCLTAFGTAKLFFSGKFFTAFFTIAVIINAISFVWVILKFYQIVPQNEEWVVQFFGRWSDIWEAGPHFKFPFFMSYAGKVFMGDQMLIIKMNGQPENGFTHSLVDFSDATAGITAEIGYRIFSSHRAVFEVGDVLQEITEIMDVIIRVYFSGKTLDQAMRERSQIGLNQLVEQDKDNFGLFKTWGVEIRSITIDFTLPEEVIAKRNSILAAEKELEAAKIEKQEALVRAAERFQVSKVDAKSTLVSGQAKGEGMAKTIKAIADEVQLPVKDVVEYLRQLSFYEAIKNNKGVIISSPNGQVDEPAAFGAKVAAGSQLTNESLKGGEVSDIQASGGE
jgi:regulator of protease activity HflC (stomatin/prohibitin superfamily)